MAAALSGIIPNSDGRVTTNSPPSRFTLPLSPLARQLARPRYR
jgi:hypothetical protein